MNKYTKTHKYDRTDFHKIYGYTADPKKLNTDEYKGISSKDLIKEYNMYAIQIMKGNMYNLFKARELSYYLIHCRNIDPSKLMFMDQISLNRSLIKDKNDNIYLRYSISGLIGYFDPITVVQIPIGYNANSKAIKKLHTHLSDQYNPDLF